MFFLFNKLYGYLIRVARCDTNFSKFLVRFFPIVATCAKHEVSNTVLTVYLNLLSNMDG